MVIVLVPCLLCAMGTFVDLCFAPLWHLLSILELFIFPWKSCYTLLHPLLSFFFSCLHVGLKTWMHRFTEKTITFCILVLSDPIFVLNYLCDCSWVLSWQCHRTNHSHPKVSFSSGKSCMKGPCPCYISYVLQVILSSVQYGRLLTISVCVITANPATSFQKSPYKH